MAWGRSSDTLVSLGWRMFPRLAAQSAGGSTAHAGMTGPFLSQRVGTCSIRVCRSAGSESAGSRP
jgi:hypothetical protein